MNRFTRLALMLLCLITPAIAATPYVTVTGSSLTDSSGNAVNNATITFTPVLNNGTTPLSFRKGATGGQTIVTPVSATVTSGAFSVLLVDSSLTTPANACYQVTVTDNVTGNQLLGAGYGCVQPSTTATSWCAGLACNFDAYTPNLAGLIQTQTGPAGPTGATGPTGPPGGSLSYPGVTSDGSNGLVVTGTVSGSVNSVLNPMVCGLGTKPSWCSGSDVGAWVNAAAAALGAAGGNIFIPATTTAATYTTTIMLPDSVNLSGTGKTGTVLRYTGTGTALQVGNWSKVSNLGIFGTGSTGTGILMAGAYSSFEHVYVRGFAIGLTFGNGAYLDRFFDLMDVYNTRNLYYPTGLTNSGENISFVSSAFGNGLTYTNCVQIGTAGTLVGVELSFTDTSFDTCQVVNNEGIVKMYGGHFEDGGVAADHPFLVTHASRLDSWNGDTGSYLYGVSVQMDGSVTGNALFEVDYFGAMHVFNMPINATPSIPMFALGSGSPSLEFVDNANFMTEAQLYSLASGSVALLSISTTVLDEHTATDTHVFANNESGYQYPNNQATILRDNFFGSYQWSGSGGQWLGEQLKPTGQGSGSPGFQVCGSGYFAFAGYNALGSETTTCGTTITTTGVVSTLFQESLTTPASSSAACTMGQFTDDANYHYVCTATNTWKRVALSSF